jgi:hypothetical protein
MVEIPCSWVEPASGAPDGRFPHSARAQGVGARGKNRYVRVPHKLNEISIVSHFLKKASVLDLCVIFEVMSKAVFMEIDQ